MRAAVAVAAALLVTSACAAPQPEAVPSPAPSLAARPSALPGDGSPSDAPSGESAPPQDPASAEAATEPGTTSPSTEPSGSTAQAHDDPTSPRRPATFATIAEIDDPQSDAGIEGPDWADLTALALEDDATTLRIVIDFADELPAMLGEDEVVGIGVDFLREEDGESRYQVFVDGGSDGWYAYFQRRDGFIPFPGTFSLGGSRIVLTIPAESIGNPVEGEWRSFLEWSGRSLVLRPVANDRVPDEGWHAFRR